MYLQILLKDIYRVAIFASIAAASLSVQAAQAKDVAGQTPVIGCKGAYTATQWSTTKTNLSDGTVKVITGQVDLVQSSSGQMRMTAHAWSDGSERKPQPITRITIQDWKNHKFIMLFPNDHIASTATLPALTSTDPSLIPKSIKTDLGSKIIHGIAVTGERDVYTSMEPGGTDGAMHEVTRTDEGWANRKMCLTMEDTTRDSSNNTGHNETTSVSAAEPDASLFEIPPGYSIQHY